MLKTITPVTSAVTSATEILPYQCQITIKGESNLYYNSIHLSCGMGEHTKFYINIDADIAHEDAYLGSLPDPTTLIGKEVGITFYRGHTITTAETTNYCSGFITKATYTQTENHKPILHIEGCSTSIIYDQHSTYRIFQNESLGGIAQKTSRNACPIICEDNTLLSSYPLLTQCHQTDFEFLCWLAHIFGVPFYYKEDKLVFGHPTKAESCFYLSLSNNLTTVQYKHTLQPTPQVLHTYNFHQDNLATTSGTSIKNEQAYYAAQHIDAAKKIMPTSAYLAPLSGHALEIDRYRKALDTRAAFNAYYLEVSTTEYRLYVGARVKIIDGPIPESEDDQDEEKYPIYIVISIDHSYNGRNIYSNTATLVPANYFLYAGRYRTPQTYDHSGVIIKGPNESGEMLVDIDGANPACQVWLPVSRTDGIHFLPTYRTRVIIKHAQDNPNLPYIADCLPNANNTDGVNNVGNIIRTISSPAGHEICFNDGEETCSLTMKDRHGNSIVFDSKSGAICINANKGIKLQGGDNIDITAKTMTLNCSENIQLNSTKNCTIQATESLNIHAGNMLNLCGDNTKVEGGRELKVLSGKKVTIAGDKLNVHAQNDCNINATKQACLRAPDTSLMSIPNAPNTTFPKLDNEFQFVVEFYPDMKTYNGEYGFDWAECDEKGNILKVQGTDINKLTHIYDNASDSFIDVTNNPQLRSQRLLAEYKQEKFYNYNYIIPYLSMVPMTPKQTITLKMKLHFLNKDAKPDPKKDYVKVAKNEYYKVTINGQNTDEKYIPTTDGAETTITITCNKPGPQQVIKFLDETDQPIGKIYVMGNTKILHIPIYVVCLVKDGPNKKEEINKLIKTFTDAKVEDALNKHTYNQALIQYTVKTNPDWYLAFNENEWEKAGYYDKHLQALIDKDLFNMTVDFAYSEFLKNRTDKQQFQKGIIIFISFQEKGLGGKVVTMSGESPAPATLMDPKCIILHKTGLTNGTEEITSTVQHEIGHILRLNHVFKLDKSIEAYKNIQTAAQKEVDTFGDDVKKVNNAIEKNKQENDKYRAKYGKDSPLTAKLIELKTKQIPIIKKEIQEKQAIIKNIGDALMLFNKTKYQFAEYTTHNVMDYSLNQEQADHVIKRDPMKKNTFFKWQWDIMRVRAEQIAKQNKKI